MNRWWRRAGIAVPVLVAMAGAALIVGALWG